MPLKQVHQEHAHAIAHFTPEVAQLFNLLQVLHIQLIPAIPEPLRTSPAQKPPSGGENTPRMPGPGLGPGKL